MEMHLIVQPTGSDVVDTQRFCNRFEMNLTG